MSTTTWDEAALQPFLEQAWPSAWRLAHRIVGCPEAAADVTQEAFLRAIRSGRSSGAPRSWRPWLYRIVVNTARNHLRDGQRRRWREARVPARWAPSSAEERELAEWVQARLADLDPDTRAALVLHYLEGLTLREVAQVLRCPQGTASSRVRRGLEALRARCDDDPRERTPAAQLVPLLLLGPEAPAVPRAARLLGLASVTTGTSTIAAVGALLLVAALGAALVGSRSEASPELAVGYQPTSSSVSSETAEPAAPAGGAVAPVVSADGPAPLEPGHCRARGQVLDERGRPIAGARIALGVADRAETDKAGWFELESSQARVEIASASGYEYPTVDGRGRIEIEPTDPEPPTPFSFNVYSPGREPHLAQLPAGDHELELRLELGGVELQLELRLAGSERPVEGRVHLRNGVFEHEAVSDERGAATFTGLASGNCSLRVYAEGFSADQHFVLGPGRAQRRVVRSARLRTLELRLRHADGSPWSGSVRRLEPWRELSIHDGVGYLPDFDDQPLTLLAGERERVDAGIAEATWHDLAVGPDQDVLELVIPTTPRLPLRGVVENAAGTPVLVGVSLSPTPRQHRLEVTSDSSGRFVFDDLPPGRYRLEVRYLEVRPGRYRRVTGSVEVELSADAPPVVLRWEEADWRTRDVHLHVVDGEGRSVSRVWVAAWGMDDTRSTGQTDNQGRLTLPVLLATDDLSIEPSGVELMPTRIALEPGAEDLTLEIVLRRRVRIGLTVEAPVDGPVAAWVEGPQGEQIWNQYDRLQLAELYEGQAQFGLLAPAGRGDLVLVTRAPGLAPVRRPLPLRDRDDEVRVTLTDSLPRVVQVLDAQGAPVADAAVELFLPSRRERVWRLGRTDTAGELSVSGLVRGDRLRIRSAGREVELEVGGGALRVQLPG